MPTIRSLVEADLPVTWRIARAAFGTFMGVPDIEKHWLDRDLHTNRFRSENVEAVVAEEDGAIVGSNFATRWGSLGFFGPVSIRPDRWDGGCAQPLVAAACEMFERWGVTHQCLFTFPHSTKHIHLYGKFGFYPRFLTAVMARPAQAAELPDYSRYREFVPTVREVCEAGARVLTDGIYDGLDLTGEIRAVAAQELGDTLLLWDGPSSLAGFAVCHWGRASEAGAGVLYIKFAVVRGGPGADARFQTLLDRAGALAASVGMGAVLAGVNLGREEAYLQMKALGFRTQFQGIAMHRGNEPGYCRPGVYAIDDWR